MKVKSLFILAILPLLLQGCAKDRGLPERNEALIGKVRDKFEQDIRANGLKLFTYSLMRSGVEAQNAPIRLEQQKRQPQPKAGRRDRDNALEQWEQQVELGLANTLKMNGYCRDGYIEISRLVESDRAEIRGECKEGASEEDRRHFTSQR
ncbi:hypothetical protein [Shewanella sedimentimangrovi]|uniref:Lipoprotein n=1 Tax=Shewanella sedimentimangrovi TaxID=2814293 RepID=A0ABX7QX52_9GAMM|nr:hypothetical protein [Shewanella sedimentimangrovi]QSX35809.1 hypothetical protein JYB85_10540 [Shewanella sedimentimangrovi]